MQRTGEIAAIQRPRREIGVCHPDLAGVVEAIDKHPARGIHQADGLRSLGITATGWNVGNGCKRYRIEDAYAAVVLLTICEGLVMAVEGPYWASVIEVAGEDAGAAGGILNTGGNIGGTLSASLTPLTRPKSC